MSTKIVELDYGIRLQLKDNWIDEPTTANFLEIPPLSSVRLSDQDDYTKYQFFNFFRIMATNSYTQCPTPQLKGLMLTKIADRISNNSKITVITEDSYLDLLQLLTLTAKKDVRTITLSLMGDKVRQLCIALRKMCSNDETIITVHSIHDDKKCLGSTELRQAIILFSLLISWLKLNKLNVNLQLISDYIKYDKTSNLIISINRPSKDIITGNIIIKNWSISKKKFLVIDWITMTILGSGRGIGAVISQYLPFKSNSGIIKLVDEYLDIEEKYRIFNDIPITEDDVPQGRIYYTNIYTGDMSIIEVPSNYSNFLIQLEESYLKIITWINIDGGTSEKARISMIDEC